MTFKKALITIFWLIITILLISCSGNVIKRDINSLVLYPSPPDTTRIQYLMSFSKSSDITGEQSDFDNLILGNEQVMEIQKPYGIAVSKNRIIICDTKLGGLEIINPEESKFDYFKPGGMGQFKKPVNCHIDSDNNIYVVDVDRKDIIVFDSTLNYKTSVGLNQLIKPTDVFVKDEKIYVADVGDQKVKIFSKNSTELLSSFPDTDESDTAYLHQPTNLYVTDNEIFVTDFGEFNVKIYDLNGNFLRSTGSLGSSAGQLARPKGISVDKDNNLYVVDAAFENVQLFNSESQLLLSFGGPYNGPGTMYLPAKVVIDYTNIDYYMEYVHDSFELLYLIFVTNQFGPDKVSVYGFVKPK